MQIRDALQLFQQALLSLYDTNESRSISEIVFMNVFNLSKVSLFANDQLTVSENKNKTLGNYLNRLLTGEPVQYVLGETEFYGLKFSVNKNVLIPRPETEELVEWIIHDIRNSKLENRNSKLIDIGTGSGCIPIAIKKNISLLDVYGLDISADALSVAIQNGAMNKVKVNFIEADILNDELSIFENTKFNLVVSNPPYVRKSEIKLMHQNVTHFEPHLALFVDDDDALLFYNHIAEFAIKHLAPAGKLYFEINEEKGNEIKDLLMQKGFHNITFKNDFFKKERMIRCEL